MENNAQFLYALFGDVTHTLGNFNIEHIYNHGSFEKHKLSELKASEPSPLISLNCKQKPIGRQLLERSPYIT